MGKIICGTEECRCHGKNGCMWELTGGDCDKYQPQPKESDKNHCDELKYHGMGEWVPLPVFVNIGQIYKCSLCGRYVCGELERTNFCSACGADMRGEETR